MKGARSGFNFILVHFISFHFCRSVRSFIFSRIANYVHKAIQGVCLYLVRCIIHFYLQFLFTCAFFCQITSLFVDRCKQILFLYTNKLKFCHDGWIH